MRPLSKTHAAVCGTTTPRPPIGGKLGGGVFSPSQERMSTSFQAAGTDASPLSRGERPPFGAGVRLGQELFGGVAPSHVRPEATTFVTALV